MTTDLQINLTPILTQSESAITLPIITRETSRFTQIVTNYGVNAMLSLVATNILIDVSAFTMMGFAYNNKNIPLLRSGVLTFMCAGITLAFITTIATAILFGKFDRTTLTTKASIIKHNIAAIGGAFYTPLKGLGCIPTLYIISQVEPYTIPFETIFTLFLCMFALPMMGMAGKPLPSCRVQLLNSTV